MRQADVFLEGEGEQWFARNQSKLPVEDDPIISAIESARIKPGVTLEVGCSNGWRVKLMQKKWGCKAYGIDPMFKTTAWDCMRGTADDLRMFEDNKFDMVIYGWVLYLIDREDLFKVVCEGDRVLKDGGHLVIYDFLATPHSRKYKHKEGIFSYKMNYANLWLGNPVYNLISKTVYGDDENKKTATIILKKDISSAFPLRKTEE